MPISLFSLDDTPPPTEEIEKISDELESELGDFLDDLEKDFEEIEIPEIPDEPEEDIGFWTKLKIFWSLPFSIKAELMKDHVGDHKLAYGAGTITLIGAIVGFIVYRRRKKKKS
jgi:hypothetical protein